MLGEMLRRQGYAGPKEHNFPGRDPPQGRLRGAFKLFHIFKRLRYPRLRVVELAGPSLTCPPPRSRGAHRGPVSQERETRRSPRYFKPVDRAVPRESKSRMGRVQ